MNEQDFEQLKQYAAAVYGSGDEGNSYDVKSPEWSHLDWRNLPDPEDLTARDELSTVYPVIDAWYETVVADNLESTLPLIDLESTLCRWLDRAFDYLPVNEGISRFEEDEHRRYSNMILHGGKHAVHPDHDFDDLPAADDPAPFVVCWFGAINEIDIESDEL